MKLVFITLATAAFFATIAPITAEAGAISSLIGFAVKKETHNSTDSSIAQFLYNNLLKSQGKSTPIYPQVKILDTYHNPLSNREIVIADVNGVDKKFLLIHGKVYPYVRANPL